MPAPQGIFGYFFNWKSLRLLSYPMYCLVKPFSTSQIHHQQLILTLLPPIQAEYRFFPSVLVGDRTKILEYLNHQDQETILIYTYALREHQKTTYPILWDRHPACP